MYSKIFRSIVALLFMVTTHCTYGQFVVVADPVFAKDLTKLYPSIMSADSLSLDTVASKTISGSMYFQNSNCSNVEELKYFTGLNHLQLWKCSNVAHIPDLSASTLLTQLDLRGTKFSNLPELLPLKNQLTALWLRQIAGGTNVSDFSLLNQFTQLAYIQISGFYPPKLPDYNSFPGLAGVNVTQNRLSFKDLIPLTIYSSFGSNLTLMPQSKLTPDTLIDLYCNEALTIAIPIDVGITGVTYAFYKDNLLVQDFSTSNTYYLPSTSESDSGKYFAVIKSDHPYFVNDSLVTGNFIVKTEKSLNCVNLFSPNGDNVDDELQLEGTGDAIVRNKQGNVVKIIRLPGSWDGTDIQGRPVDIGLYSVSIGSKVRTVTVLR